MPPSAEYVYWIFVWCSLLQGLVGLGPLGGTGPLSICMIKGKKEGGLTPLICKTSFFILVTIKFSSPCNTLQASYEYMFRRTTTTMATKIRCTNFILLGK
ncbi:hypothetical protein PRUPE_8G228500 [Prunus persica]|uniref:Uncharacterized protein n=1 Tax=Prunus persica TaxID=3760 RepID=A0A251N1Z3_PRUPE|nr:hypothetical protein PRUPE_8G228500 [Prunus persica]